ncbi:hypothetical protein, partial [Enterococcus faecalis]|uniref:hypothetical protein n=1 Tax=Enterococcus faecalis TaxID=1351 RepID=UPI001E630E78
KVAGCMIVSSKKRVQCNMGVSARRAMVKESDDKIFILEKTAKTKMYTGEVSGMVKWVKKAGVIR